MPQTLSYRSLPVCHKRESPRDTYAQSRPSLRISTLCASFLSCSIKTCHNLHLPSSSSPPSNPSIPSFIPCPAHPSSAQSSHPFPSHQTTYVSPPGKTSGAKLLYVRLPGSSIRTRSRSLLRANRLDKLSYSSPSAPPSPAPAPPRLSAALVSAAAAEPKKESMVCGDVGVEGRWCSCRAWRWGWRAPLAVGAVVEGVGEEGWEGQLLPCCCCCCCCCCCNNRRGERSGLTGLKTGGGGISPSALPSSSSSRSSSSSSSSRIGLALPIAKSSLCLAKRGSSSTRTAIQTPMPPLLPTSGVK